MLPWGIRLLYFQMVSAILAEVLPEKKSTTLEMFIQRFIPLRFIVQNQYNVRVVNIGRYAAEDVLLEDFCTVDLMSWTV